MTTGSSQAPDLTFEEWVEVLTQALSDPGTDGYRSRAELLGITGLTEYTLDKKLTALLRSGRVEVAKAYREGATGFRQKIYVYKLKKA